jgi:hypothetical protein
MSPKQLLMIAQALRALSEVANSREAVVFNAVTEALRNQGINYSDVVSAKTIVNLEMNRE